MIPLVVEWLLVASLRLAVLLAVAALLVRGLAREPAEFHVLFWRVTLGFAVVLVCLPATLTSSLVALQVPVDVSDLGGSIPCEPLGVAHGVSDSRGVVGVGVDTTDPTGALRWGVVVAVWLLGVTWCFFRLWLGSTALRSTLRRSAPPGRGWREELARLRRSVPRLPRRVSLRITSWGGAPAVYGLVSPVVLLPADSRAWSAAHRRAVLTHELLHVAHRDGWYQRLAILLRAVLWFHPGTWYVSAQLGRAHEIRCDAGVVRSGIDPLDYAETLVDQARLSRRRADGLSLAFGRTALEQRVRCLLAPHHGPSSRRHAAARCSGLLVASLAGATGLGGVTPTATFPSMVLADPVLEVRVEMNANLRIVRGESVAMTVRGADGREVSEWRDRVGVRRDGSSTMFECAALPPHLTVELALPPAVELECVLRGGNLECRTALRSIVARCTSGRMDVVPGQPFGGPIELGSGSGAIDVRLPSLDHELQASTGAGAVAVAIAGPQRCGVKLVSGAGDVSLRLADPSATRFAVVCPQGSARVQPGSASESAPLTELHAYAGKVDVRKL